MQEAKPRLPLGSGVNWLVLGVRDFCAYWLRISSGSPGAFVKESTCSELYLATPSVKPENCKEKNQFRDYLIKASYIWGAHRD